MDIKRAAPKKTKRNILIAGGVLGIVATTVALSNLEARPQGVPRAELWIDSVVRGPFVRNVRAPGTLVPEQMRYVAAVTAGRVEARPLRPGSPVTKTTVILELSNPEVQLENLNAQRNVTQAEQDLVTLRTSLESNRLAQASTVAQLTSAKGIATRDYQVILELEKKNLTSPNEVQRAKEASTELDTRLDLEKKRLDVITNAISEQVAKAEANLGRLKAISQFQQDRVNSMKVLSGEDGVLQSLNWELGQWVNPGQELARVAQPGKLKAVLRVPETQVKDVVLGQKASIDTRNGLIDGRVLRVDPISQNGTVTVEVSLEGELPRGARADLSVDGTIELERLDNVLFVARPAYGQPESTVGLFKVSADGKTAERMSVKLGRASVSTIEVQQGLQPGDSVIVSDMSRFDNVQKVRIQR
ncbi:MAG: HlyD family efflux transporter periplasmic adaptor subunit [Cytophagaceae bacterium]|nr:HlyD family efflux transporter periplasmic adaptor subunit [Gemmatimonadaceae bacterium]